MFNSLSLHISFSSWHACLYEAVFACQVSANRWDLTRTGSAYNIAPAWNTSIETQALCSSLPHHPQIKQLLHSWCLTSLCCSPPSLSMPMTQQDECNNRNVFPNEWHVSPPWSFVAQFKYPSLRHIERGGVGCGADPIHNTLLLVEAHSHSTAFETFVQQHNLACVVIRQHVHAATDQLAFNSSSS